MKEEKALLIKIESKNSRKCWSKRSRNLMNMNRSTREEIVTSVILKGHWRTKEEKVCLI